LYTSKEPPSTAASTKPKADSVWKEVRKIDVPNPTPSATHSNSKQGAASSKNTMSQTSAQIFFGAAKADLDKSDFSSLRKLLVAMKKHGDSNDVPQYLKAAGSLVDILIMYDNLESKNFEWEKSLSYLFFPLLPQARQRDVQKLALRKQLKRTEFVRQCQDHLPEKEHRDLYTSIFSALKHIYCIPPDQPFSRTAYLQSCLPVVRYLYTQGLHKWTDDADDSSEKESVLERFYVLLPSRLRTSTRALLNEIRASQSTRHVKAKEKAREGENGVDLVRFSMPKKALPPVEPKTKPDENPQDLENQRSMQASLMAADQANSAKRNRVKEQLEAGGQKKKKANPYPKSSQSSSLGAAAKVLDKKPLKPAASSVTTSRNADVTSNRSKSPPRDRVSKVLAQAELSPFAKGKSKPKVRANTKVSNCRICEQSCREVSSKLHIVTSYLAQSISFSNSHISSFYCFASHTCHPVVILLAVRVGCSGSKSPQAVPFVENRHRTMHWHEWCMKRSRVLEFRRSLNFAMTPLLQLTIIQTRMVKNWKSSSARDLQSMSTYFSS
jgi:hypothetical protein